MESSVAKRLLNVVRVVYYMLRKGFSKRKLTMDLHLLLKRGKLAGKALGNLINFHHHHHHHAAGAAAGAAAFSCRHVDPNLAFYNPREVEFSCSNTPSFPSFHVTKRKNRHRDRRHGDGEEDYYEYDAVAIAKAFEMLNDEASECGSVAATPMWSSGKSPAVVRQLRITDSPYPIREEEGEADGRVDKEAEEFIKRFYEQLRRQRSVAATPEYSHSRRGPVGGRG
ncbi:uncharacterized protein [Typha angustifolia]|uniref:uncharacterized protein n=1 Tax=Typha angustifolia TaxID=59011 RepID=UPI003C2EABDF